MTVIPLKKLDIEEDGLHVCFEAFINGIKANILIDTGASRTVFDHNRISLFESSEATLHDRLSTGLGTNSMKSHTVVIGSINLGGLIIDKFEAVLLDLSHVNESYSKLDLEPIDGVMGGDLLSRYCAIIDYGKMQLTLKDYLITSIE